MSYAPLLAPQGYEHQLIEQNCVAIHRHSILSLTVDKHGRFQKLGKFNRIREGWSADETRKGAIEEVLLNTLHAINRNLKEETPICFFISPESMTKSAKLTHYKKIAEKVIASNSIAYTSRVSKAAFEVLNTCSQLDFNVPGSKNLPPAERQKFNEKVVKSILRPTRRPWNSEAKFRWTRIVIKRWENELVLADLYRHTERARFALNAVQLEEAKRVV